MISASGAVMEFNASCHKTQGIARLEGESFFTFTPGAKAAGWFGGGFKAFQIAYVDIVGVVKTGPYTFSVWHCPVVSSKGGEIRRKLVKSAEITILQGGAADIQGGAARVADNIVQTLRQACCWWSKPEAPRITIIANPISGKGRSAQELQQLVLPLLQDAAGMKVSVHYCKAPLHAQEITQGLDLSATDMILLLGGDGTVYEALQGLFLRPDWEEAVRTPLATVPTGSGNGLAASSGMWDPPTACHAVCKGFMSALDIASVFQAPNKRHFMFLSITYGLMSNLDEGTSHLRWMGELRFVYGMLRELLRGQTYRARVAYVPATAGAYASPQPVDASGVKLERSSIRAENSEAGRLLSHYGPGPECPHLDQLEYLPAHAPDTPSAARPGWKTLGEIGLQYFGLYSPTHLALDFKANPQGGLASGSLDLHWIDGGRMTLAKRLQGLSAFIQSASGVVSPVIQQEKVAALIIEPLDGGTWMMVDGEVVQNKVVYVDMHPSLARVLVAPGLDGAQPGGGV